MDIIKGQTAEIQVIVYSYWSGQAASSVLANITGGTIKAYFKNRDGDSDANALFQIDGTIVDGLNGVAKVLIPAATTNGLSQQKIVFEVITKLADGVTYIRNGVEDLVLKPNVGKTLF